MKNPPINQIQADKLLHEGIRLHKNGKLKEAKKVFEKILKDWPNDFEAIHSLGTIEAQMLNLIKACELLEQASKLNPRNASTFFNLGLAQRDLKRFDEAILNIKRAISIEPENTKYYVDYGMVQIELKLFEDALATFDKLIDLRLEDSKVFFYRAYCFSKLNRTDEAIRSLDHGIKLDPENPQAYFNKGNELLKKQMPLEASACFGMAISINPNYAEAYHNSGAALVEIKQMQAASASYLKALELNPTLEFLFGTCLYQKLLMCEWDFLSEGLEYCKLSIDKGERVTLPFPAISFLSQDSELLNITQIFTNSKHPKTNFLPIRVDRLSHKIIRVGYYSSDFYNHATTHLIAKLLNDHDRSKFEIYGFSLVVCPHDEIYESVANSFDQFHDVSGMSDLDVVRLSRELEIDIAIDLKGYTKNNRTDIFAEGCAPLQVNYLGFPGSMGADYIDYIIADKVVIPEKSKQFFTEKVVYLPYSYQVNDSTRVIADIASSKEAHGLPSSGFVFCCFNNNYKITPEIFDVWVRILKAVDGSVLWLLEDNVIASENLYKEASVRGLDVSRLIFAKRLSAEMHLARHRFADLFIDTAPCNAHTTASDALWTGLPVLTLKGHTFAGRVAASLLTALEMPELITESLNEYEKLAIDLALNSEKLSSVRNKLEVNKLTKPLFNTALFARHIEAAYLKMYQLYQEGKSPEHIYVDK